MVRAGQGHDHDFFAIHEDLVKEGFDPSSDEYYTEVDKMIRDEFPHKFDEDSSTKTDLFKRLHLLNAVQKLDAANL